MCSHIYVLSYILLYMCSHIYVRSHILLYMCSHTILFHTSVARVWAGLATSSMRTHISASGADICVLMLLYATSSMRTRVPVGLATSSMRTHISAPADICVLTRCRYMCLMLLCMCPHTSIYVSSCYYICVLMLLYMCPHTSIYVSSYYYICVRMLLYPHTTMYVSSRYYIQRFHQVVPYKLR